jgi:hypothetical protein
VAGKLSIVEERDALVGDRGVQGVRRRHHPGVVLREHLQHEALALELLGASPHLQGS